MYGNWQISDMHRVALVSYKAGAVVPTKIRASTA